MNPDTILGIVIVKTLGTAYIMSLRRSERTYLGCFNITANMLLVELKMPTLWNICDGQYLVLWCTYTLNIDNIVEIIIVLTMGTADEMSLGMCRKTEIIYLNNTEKHYI